MANSKTLDKKTLLKMVDAIADDIIKIRRKLHTQPEIMFEEFKTAAFIREYLKQLNVSVLAPYLETDTAGIIKGLIESNGKKEKTVLLRADIDALGIEEKSGVPWQSQIKGVAHCCGHDGHTAILLGTVNILSHLADYFYGNIKFIFQPAEEGGGGGKQLVQKGLLDDEPYVDEVYALHGWPDVPKNCFESTSGAMMAAVDNFLITVNGKGGHGAMPQYLSDPVVVSAGIITALQQIVSRNCNPVDPGVVSICSINGGSGFFNVIPDSVTMKGTVRYFKKEMLDFMKSRMEEIIKGLSSAGMATYTFDYFPSYIPLVNNKESVDFAGSVISRIFGTDRWNGNGSLTTTAEDFAFYLDKRPGAFLRLGLGNGYPSLHNSLFDFDDNVIKDGITAMCSIALSSLGTDITD